MRTACFHFPRPCASGRWLVVYRVAGTATLAVATSCFTLAGAIREAERLNGTAASETGPDMAGQIVGESAREAIHA